MLNQNIAIFVENTKLIANLLEICKEADITPTVITWTEDIEKAIVSILKSNCDLLIANHVHFPEMIMNSKLNKYEKNKLIAVLYNEAIDTLIINDTGSTYRIKDFCLCCNREGFKREFLNFIMTPSKYLVKIPREAEQRIVELQQSLEEAKEELNRANERASKALRRQQTNNKFYSGS